MHNFRSSKIQQFSNTRENFGTISSGFPYVCYDYRSVIFLTVIEQNFLAPGCIGLHIWRYTSTFNKYNFTSSHEYNSACANNYLCMHVIMLVIISSSDLACKICSTNCYNLVTLRTWLLVFLNRIQERSNAWELDFLCELYKSPGVRGLVKSNWLR
jgi:hypothetical protein